MTYGMGSTGYLGWGLLKVLMFIVASYVFSAIFWWTKKWMDGDVKKRKK